MSTPSAVDEAIVALFEEGDCQLDPRALAHRLSSSRDVPADVPEPFVVLFPHPVTQGIMKKSNHMRDPAPRPPLYGFKRCMFDRAFLGAPAVHRERAARLAGW